MYGNFQGESLIIIDAFPQKTKTISEAYLDILSKKKSTQAFVSKVASSKNILFIDVLEIMDLINKQNWNDKKSKIQELIKNTKIFISDFMKEEKEEFLKKYKKNFKNSHHWHYPFQLQLLVNNSISDPLKKWLNHHKDQPLSPITIGRDQYVSPDFILVIEESIKKSLNNIGLIITDDDLPDKINEVKKEILALKDKHEHIQVDNESKEAIIKRLKQEYVNIKHYSKGCTLSPLFAKIVKIILNQYHEKNENLEKKIKNLIKKIKFIQQNNAEEKQQKTE